MAVWRPLKNPTTGVVIYNFNGKGAHKLQLQLGETVQIHEENGGWYRGYSHSNKGVVGIFPISYVKIKENRDEEEIDREDESSVIEEVTSVLREWGVIAQALYLERKVEDFELTYNLITELIEARRQIIMSETLVDTQFKQLKQKVASTIDYGNKCLGLDLVVRDEDGNSIDPESTGVIELYRKHVSTSEKANDTTLDDTKKRRENNIASTYSIYVKIKNVVCKIKDDAQVLISLYDAKEGVFIR